MDAEPYLQMKNPAALALAARMKMDQRKRVSLVRDFFLSLAATPLKHDDQEIVASFFFTYQSLTDAEALQLEMELGKVKPDAAREAVMNLNNPFIQIGKQRGLEQGLEQGLQQGRQQGEAELVIKLLARRLGALSGPQEESIRSLPLPQIEALGEALLDFTSPADFDRWMGENAKR